MPLVGDGSDISGGGPFQANTRIVAIIALTVAGVFVILGLGLSLLRALQQKAAERVSWAFSFVQRRVLCDFCCQYFRSFAIQSRVQL